MRRLILFLLSSCGFAMYPTSDPNAPPTDFLAHTREVPIEHPLVGVWTGESVTEEFRADGIYLQETQYETQYDSTTMRRQGAWAVEDSILVLARSDWYVERRSFCVRDNLMAVNTPTGRVLVRVDGRGMAGKWESVLPDDTISLIMNSDGEGHVAADPKRKAYFELETPPNARLPTWRLVTDYDAHSQVQLEGLTAVGDSCFAAEPLHRR